MKDLTDMSLITCTRSSLQEMEETVVMSINKNPEQIQNNTELHLQELVNVRTRQFGIQFCPQKSHIENIYEKVTWTSTLVLKEILTA